MIKWIGFADSSEEKNACRQENIGRSRRELVGYAAALILFLLAALLLHRLTQPLFSDDSWFSTKLDDYTLADYLIWRYTNWTSRILLETFLVVLVHGHYLLWCVLDSLMAVLLVASLGELLGMRRNAATVALISLMIAFVPVGILYSAGWIATSTNYLWPLAFGVYGLLPIRRIVDNGTFRGWEYISFSAALIVAANQEQMAAILLAFYLAAVFYLSRQEREAQDKKKQQRFLLWMIVLLILSLIFILSCPGNDLRKETEIEKWFPQFPQYHLPEKLLMGYLTTFVYYVAGIGNQLLLPVFTLILAVATACRVQKVWKRLAAFVPVAGTVVLGFPLRYSVKEGLVWHPSYYYDLFANIYLPRHDLCNYVNWQVALESIGDLILVLWMVLLLYWLFGKTHELAVMLFALAAGFGSRMIIGLSPTVYASGYRTTLFCTVILQSAGVYLLSRIRQKKIKAVLTVVLMILLIVTICYETDGKTY